MLSRWLDEIRALHYPRRFGIRAYGDQPIRSGQSVSIQELTHSYWRYSNSTIVATDGSIVVERSGEESEYLFAATAIAADIGKQRHGAFPRRHYIDTLRKCRGCDRWFIFFALEQRHWYEVLGFWIDADCVHCHECRRQGQRLRRAEKRYADRVTDATFITAREFSTLLKDALLLTESGIIRSDANLRRLRNLAMKRGLSGDALEAVSDFLGERRGTRCS